MPSRPTPTELVVMALSVSVKVDNQVNDVVNRKEAINMCKQAGLNNSNYSLPCKLSVSAYSTRGVKAINQDAYAYHISSTGLNQSNVFVIADGVSSSTVSQVASDFATSQFIRLFNIAPEQWSVKTRAETVIKEINARLYTRTQKSPFCYTPEKGYVCTLSVAIITDNHVDVFHVGDCQIQVASEDLKAPVLLTRPHRQVSDSAPSHTYLLNALGAKASVDIDHTSFTLASSSTLAISSDGVYEFVSLPDILNNINRADTFSENQAESVVHEAFHNGSEDNLTLLLIKFKFCLINNDNDNERRAHSTSDLGCSSETVSSQALSSQPISTKPCSSKLGRLYSISGARNADVSDADIHDAANNLFVEPVLLQNNGESALAELSIGNEIDGFTLSRQLYSSARSHVFIATLTASAGAQRHGPVVIKAPATDFTQSPEMLNGFLIESWFSRRINSAHVIKSPMFKDLGLPHTPSAFYSVSEYVQGQTLAQWSIDNPTPTLEQVRNIIEQVGKGLQALHRQGILHRDIRLENVIISAQGHCTIIDLGSAALAEAPSLYSDAPIPGTALFAAPEYFLGNIGTERSDLFSLAVLTYYLLCGRYPYHTKLAHCHTFAEQKKLKYETALDSKRPIPVWVDSALKRALHVNPDKRFSSLSEFIYALRYPNPSHHTAYEPLVKKHPLFVYKVLVLALIFSNLVTLILIN